MPKLQNLLNRRPVVVELDPEVQARVRARLNSLRDLDDPHAVDADAPKPDRGPRARGRRNANGQDDAGWDIVSTAAPLRVAPDEPPFGEPDEPAPEPDLSIMVPMDTTFVSAPRDVPEAPAALEPAEAAVQPEVPEPEESALEPAEAALEPAEAALEPAIAAVVEAPLEPEVEAPIEPEVAAVVEAPLEPPPAAPAAVSRPVAARPPVERRKASRAVVSCPYCAEPLKVPPVASGRCPRCRQRIVVRRIGDRAIYLTLAALPVFQAERRRATHAGRWTRERDRWLEHAMAVGADPSSVTRITRQPVSEAVIASSRNLYMSLVERAARAARKARRWEDASTLRGDQAMVLYRIARSPRPVPPEVLAVHRDGLASSLRGIAEIAKVAELRAATCCDACRADDGRTVRIAEELRRPSLPHEACAKGLCHCRWSLADRDRTIVSDLLKRQTRLARPRR